MITKITAVLLATSLLVACGGTASPPVTAQVQTPAQIAAAAKVTADKAAADKAAADKVAADKAAADKVAADKVAADKAAADKAAADKAAAAAAAAAAVPKTFNQINTAFSDIFNLYGNNSFQDPNTLPTTPGAVSYQGFSALILQTASPVNLRGTSSLTLDLGKASGFSGTFSDFVDQADTSVPGTLTISNGAINRTATAGQNTVLTGNLGGQLTVNNNPAAFNGTVGGDIVLPTRQFLDGGMNGNVTFGGTTTAFTGQFVAQK